MTTVSRQTAAQPGMLRIITSAPLRLLALAALCSAYIQGPLIKIFDFQSALDEMNHFGLPSAPLFAIVVIVFELTMSALVVTGLYRWMAALALSGFTMLATLLALRFWEIPPGMARSMAMNGFFEHVGLACAFVLVASGNLLSHPDREGL